MQVHSWTFYNIQIASQWSGGVKAKWEVQNFGSDIKVIFKVVLNTDLNHLSLLFLHTWVMYIIAVLSKSVHFLHEQLVA